MNKLVKALIPVLAVILVSLPSRGQEMGTQSKIPAETAQAATRSLENFRRLVDAQNYRELGFDSPDQAAAASLGQPLKVYLVKLDQLRDYKAGADPEALLSDINQVYYPITVGGQARSGIVLELKNGEWKGVSFGNSGLARKLAELRQAAAPGGAQLLVELPVLGLDFLGQRGADNKLTLTSLSAAPEYKIEAGTAISADQAFTTLAPFARDYNGLPM